MRNEKRPAVVLSLDGIEARTDATGPRVCKWPACPRPAVRAPGADADPDADGDGDAAGGARPAGGGDRRGRPGRGRRPEFCSAEHRKRNAETVRVLRALLPRAEELRDAATGRQRRRADAAVADLVHRLALHGEPAAAHLAGEPSAQTVAAATGTGTVLASVVELRPRAASPAAAGAQAPADGGAEAGVVALDDRRDRSGPDARGVPVPVLGLRRSTTRAEFGDSWLRLRDAADAARAVLTALRRAEPGNWARLAAAVHLELADLAHATDQVLLDLALLPHASGASSAAAPARGSR